MRSCEMSSNRISQMVKGKKIDHKNGVLFYHVANWSKDSTKYEQIMTFKDLFQFYERENFPIQYRSTSNPDEAYFKIYFVSESGKVFLEDGVTMFDSPVDMGSDVLAVAFAPYGGKWDGCMFINDRWYWNMKSSDKLKKDLLPTLIHELAHNYNIDHSSNPKSLMYKEERDKQEWLLEESKLMFTIYASDRIDAVKNSHSAKLFVEYIRSISGKRSTTKDSWWHWLIGGIGVGSLIQIALEKIIL